MTPTFLFGQAEGCRADIGIPTACPAPGEPKPGESERSWEKQAAAFGANTIAGGLSAGLLQKTRGGSFLDGFRRGALGGGVTYLGKRLAASQATGAGLAGRELAAVGSSIVRNAASGNPSLHELILPLGPTNLYVRPRDEARVRLKIDPIAAALMTAAVLDSDLKLDAGSTLSSGALVSRDRGWTAERDWAGLHAAGVIRVRGDPAIGERSSYSRRILAHERIHVIQYDQSFRLWGEPLGGRLLPHLPGGGFLWRWFDLALDAPLWALVGLTVDYESRPWEAEALLFVPDRRSLVTEGPRLF